MKTSRILLGAILLAPAMAFGQAGYEWGVQDILLMNDSRMVLVGTTSDDALEKQFALARISSNGMIDETFGDHGYTYTDVTTACDFIRGGALDSENRIIVIGTAGSECDGAKVPERMVLARYTVDGKLDPTFGQGGIADVLPFDAWARQMVLLPDGRIFGIGWQNSGNYQNFVVGFTPSGALDTTFGDQGIVYFTAQEPAEAPCGRGVIGAIKYDPSDETLLIGGHAYCDTANPAGSYLKVTKLDLSGHPVTAFGKGGTGSQYAGFINSVGGITIQLDGRIVVFGGTDSGAGLNEGGIKLAAFNGAGASIGFPSVPVITAHLSAGYVYAGDALTDSTGHLVVAATQFVESNKPEEVTTERWGLFAFDENYYGLPTFGGGITFGTGNGRLILRPFGLNSVQFLGKAMALPEGKLLVAGATISTEGAFAGAITRLNPDGTYDTTFGVNGVMAYNFLPPGYLRTYSLNPGVMKKRIAKRLPGTNQLP